MKPLRYGSVCSGIEAASVAWDALGWTPGWFCEIDPFASAVLAHRFPEVPNHGDFTRLLDPAHPVHADPIDVLVGGTPCQDFSVAGLRAGIEGDRGSLTLDFCRLVGVLRPRWVVWENVPGVLSSDGGRALGAFLGALAELGYGFAWRVLDAQYFGLAQRRKRVFVVGCAGAQSSRAGAVLLEPEGVRGDPPARRKAGQVAATAAAGGARGGGSEGHVVAPPLTATNDPSRSPQSAEVTAQVSAVVHATMGGQAFAFNGYARTVGDVATPLMAEDYKKVEIGVLVPEREVTITRKDVANTLDASYYKGPGSRQGGEREYVAHVAAPPVYVMAFDYKQSGGDAVTEMSPTLRATPHANTWANGGGHVGIVNVEHGLNDHGSMEVRDLSEPITASERKGHSVVLQEPMTFDWQAGGGQTSEFQGETRVYITDPPGRTRALNACKTLAVLQPESQGFDILGTPATEVEKETEVHTPLRARTPGQFENSTVTVVVTDAVAFTTRGREDGLAVESQDELAYALKNPGSGGRTNDRMVATAEAFAFQPRIARNGRGQPEPISPTLNGADAGATSDMRPCVVQPNVKASHFTRGKDGAPSEVAPPLSADADRGDQDTLVFTSDGIVADPVSANEGRTYTHEGNVFRMHNCVSQPPVSMRESGPGYWLEDEVTGTLDAHMGASGHANRVATLTQPPTMSVRRLTPRECERLQGFPDDWTLVPYRKGESSDSNRYRALGNSMAVPVMRWIGARIARVDRE